MNMSTLSNFMTKPKSAFAIGVAALATSAIGYTTTDSYKNLQQKPVMKEIAYKMDNAKETIGEAYADMLSSPLYWGALAGLGTLCIAGGVAAKKENEEAQENNEIKA